MNDFIAKKREIFLVQMSLDTKRAEITKLEERALQVHLPCMRLHCTNRTTHITYCLACYHDTCFDLHIAQDSFCTYPYQPVYHLSGGQHMPQVASPCLLLHK